MPHFIETKEYRYLRDIQGRLRTFQAWLKENGYPSEADQAFFARQKLTALENMIRAKFKSKGVE